MRNNADVVGAINVLKRVDILPCLQAGEDVKKTDAVSNFLWISDTISKYNRCVKAKDKEVNNEKP